MNRIYTKYDMNFMNFDKMVSVFISKSDQSRVRIIISHTNILLLVFLIITK
jgi:hypothetical protein